MEKRQVGQTELTIDTLGLGGAPLGGNFVELGYGQAAELILDQLGGLTIAKLDEICLLYTSPSPRDRTRARMPSSA